MTVGFAARGAGERRSLSVAVVLVLSTVIAFWSGTILADDRRRAESGPLTSLWEQLDAARLYRCAEVLDDGRCKINSYSTMVAEYDKPSLSGVIQGRSSRQVFSDLLDADSGFPRYLSDPAWAQEAEWGVQEALNELMSGQLLVGNDRLVRGLSFRFPNAPRDKTPQTLFAESAGEFGAGLNAAMTVLLLEPGRLRKQGEGLDLVPFWVENSYAPPQVQGEPVENELWRLTELVRRNGLAMNAAGQRAFYDENTDEDKRSDAARQLQHSAQITYLHTAVLAAVQTQEQFESNNGFEVKREVVDAQRTFDDIIAGFNPLTLRGDFVPRVSLEELLGIFAEQQQSALRDELGYKYAQRENDQDATALKTDLAQLRAGQLTRIAALTGIGDLDPKTLLTASGRQRLLALARQQAQSPGAFGELRDAQLDVELQDGNVKRAAKVLGSYPEQIETEEERAGSVAQLTLSTGAKVSALQFAVGMVSAYSINCGATGCEVTFFPGEIIKALVAQKTTLLEAATSAAVSNINSAAQIRNLLIQEAVAAIDLENAGKSSEAAQATLNGRFAELERAIQLYVSAREDFEAAYYNNPAYRIALEEQQRKADASFQQAMINGYSAAKALEYEWAERYANPYYLENGGTRLVGGVAGKFGPVVAAESIFSVASAGSDGAPEPSLTTFGQALKQWDVDLRGDRTPQGEIGRDKDVSVRERILGLSGPDSTFNDAAFSDFVEEHRIEVPGQDKRDLRFEFNLQIADEWYFPASQPNLKIENVTIDLLALPGKALRPGGSNEGAALVNLYMRDRATVRPLLDSEGLITINLEGARTLDEAKFAVEVPARISGYPSTVPPATGLENLSPAVSRWVLWIKMNNDRTQNSSLVLENLRDIKIKFKYRYGKPRTFAWPIFN